MRALAGLNPQQVEAVRCVDRPLLVVAGAGSGKTRVLAHKIAYLVEECGVPPGAVLAMTFSNKAAKEMRERVRQLLPRSGEPSWVGTFHATCVRILREFAAEAGLPPHFSIYDETDQLSAIRRALQELGIDPKQVPPKVVRYQIDRAKNETPDILRHLARHAALTERGLKVVKRYEEMLGENNACDFGSLLTRTVRLLRSRGETAACLHDRWPRILIDEYQDTNRIQKELVRLLAGKTGTVCAVGDEDQSIYGWRGARVENILEFEADFPGAALVKLERNYRSTRRILAAANDVIAHNVGRRGKRLWTENPEGEAVTFFQAADDRGEATFVLDKIEDLLRRGVTSAGGIAVFYRTHAQSRLFEDECRRRNRAYRIFGGVRFYDRSEIKDCLAYLNLALNPHDNVSFLRAVNSPPRGIGEKTLQLLAREAHARKLAMFAAIPHFGGAGRAAGALRAFFAWYAPLPGKIPGLPPAQAAETILTESGYFEALEKENTIEADSRIENLKELLRTMEEFEEEERGDLAAYLDRIALISDTDDYDAQAEALTMMTLHNSKGLEFDCVFLVGMEEGVFPHLRSIEQGDPEELEEERRLCYVGMTRARKELCLSAAFRRRLYHSTHFNPVSRFVTEIASPNLVGLSDTESPASVGLADRADAYRRWRSRRKGAGAADEFRQESYDDLPAHAEGASGYSPGTRVVHPHFGLGTVRKCEGSPANLKLTIHFRRGGVKKVLVNYCALERVDA